MGNSKERIVQLRLVGFVDVRDIQAIIDSFYESSIVINFTEKETNNSLMFRIVKSFYGEKSEGVEKTTRAEIVFKKTEKEKLNRIYYKYTNVYTSVDDIGDNSIDEKMRTNGFTKLTFKVHKEEDVEGITEVFKNVASRLNLEGYIINVDVMNNRKEIKWSEYIEPENFEFPDVNAI